MRFVRVIVETNELTRVSLSLSLSLTRFCLLTTVRYEGGKLAVTGIVEFAADDFRKRWWPNLKEDWSNAQVIDCIPLQDIIQEHYLSTNNNNNGVHFDFLSLDVEGAEDQVLRSINYNLVSFGIILLEADEHNERKNLAIRVFLEANGYTYLRQEQRSYWFVHRQFDQMYRHVLHNSS